MATAKKKTGKAKVKVKDLKAKKNPKAGVSRYNIYPSFPKK
ncbi:MAG: hypothetical protein ABIR71_03305 [Chthoniobacterales bacterium]